MDEKQWTEGIQGPEDRKRRKVQDPEELPQKIATLLNEILRLDPTALHNLINTRVFCGSELEHHPTICVEKDEETGISQLGVLGILNGLCEGDHKVVMYYEPEDLVIQYFDVLDVSTFEIPEDDNGS